MGSEVFIRRPVATALLMIGIVLLGLVSYRQLGVSSLPNVDFPVIFVRTTLPGGAPETMASSVSTPLERQLGTISGINEMTSISSLGTSFIIMEFDLNRSLEDAARDVQAAINAAEPNLPKDLPSQPEYIKANPNWQPAITFALTSDTIPPSKVYDYADTIVVQKLSQIEGVSEVSISGADASAVRVQVEPGALANMGLSLEDVRASIQQSTVDKPKGSLEGGASSWAVAANDQLFEAAQYRRIVVAWRNGAPVRLGDIAKVSDSVANNKLAGWYNTENAVIVQVQKQPSANMVAVVDRVKAALPQVQRWLPPGIRMHVVADRTVTIRQAIHDVQRTMALSIAMVIGVIAMFLRRFWATVIPSLTIPVALSATLAVMYLANYTLDNLSLMALMVASGFVVDDAIVMIENIVRLIEGGMPPMEAAIQGTRQMTFTIVSITLSLFSALVPMTFGPGIMGRFLREFGVTLSAAIIVSAIVSLTLTPMMCSRLLTRDSLQTKPPRTGFGRMLAAFPDYYLASLRWTLGWPKTMVALTIAITVATIYLYVIVPKGTMPTQDTGVIKAVTDAPPDISFAAMGERQRSVAKVVLADPAVESLTSYIGGGFFGGGMNSGNMTINLKPFAERKLAVEKVIDRLRPALAKLIGIDTYLAPVQDFGNGARAGKSRYQFTVSGSVDLPTLQHWTDLIRSRLAAVPELTDIATDQDASGLQTSLSIDRPSAAKLGISPSIIDQTLYDAFGQRQVATMYTDIDQFKVILEVDPADQADPAALGRIYLPGGKQVPLSAVTRTTDSLAAVSLNHQGQMPAITIGFNTPAGVPIGNAMAAITKTVDALHLPPQITAGFQGDALEVSDSGTDMLIILGAAFAAMYIVLGVLYESYAHPFTILSTIPSAGLGALLGLLAMHMDFSFVALIGIILLIGIVKKNAILMVDFALVAERQLGLTPREAILRAARLRFRPITMTTLAAGLGALPTAIGIGVGSELREPLGVTIIGGLLVSQVVTLYTTPVVYLAVNRMRRWRPFRRRASRWLPSEVPAE